MSKKTVVAACTLVLAVAALLGFAQDAGAQSFALRYSTDGGSSWTQINDSSPSDIATQPGIITVNAITGIWTLNLQSGQGAPFIPLSNLGLSSDVTLGS